MRLIENAPAVVSPQATGDPHPWVPVGEIRCRHEDLPTIRKDVGHLPKEHVRARHVFNDVGGDHDVVADPSPLRNAVLEVAEHELVNSITDTVDLDAVHTSDVMTQLGQSLRQSAA